MKYPRRRPLITEIGTSSLMSLIDPDLSIENRCPVPLHVDENNEFPLSDEETSLFSTR